MNYTHTHGSRLTTGSVRLFDTTLWRKGERQTHIHQLVDYISLVPGSTPAYISLVPGSTPAYISLVLGSTPAYISLVPGSTPAYDMQQKLGEA